MRQQMEQHRANPVCASCHARMDPIGFALENYDGSRQMAHQGRRLRRSTLPANCPAARSSKGPAGLKKLLLADHRDDFVPPPPRSF